MLVLALVAALVAGSAQPTSSPDRTSTELLSAFLDALTYADAARQKLDEDHSAKKPVEQFVAEMTNQRIAKRRFLDARSLFVNEIKSKRDAVRLLGEAMTGAFESLAAACDRAIALYESMVKAKTEAEIATLLSQASEIRADVDESWRVLPQAALALSYALVDEGRPTNGKIDRLRLSMRDRTTAVARIKREYPKASQQEGGHAIDVSASLLLKFLTGAHKSADERH